MSIEKVLNSETRLSSEDLAKASGRRQEMGGRLETALLELGLLSESELSPALAAHYGLPPATVEDLQDIPESVLTLLSSEQAGSYRVVPFSAGPGRADLAASRALDIEKLDELAFLLGRRVRLFVINEVRIAQALLRHYAQSQPARLLNLADRLDRGLGRSRDLETELPSSASAPPPLVPGTFGTDAPSSDAPKLITRRVTPTKPREVLKSIELTSDERDAIFGDPEEDKRERDAVTAHLPASDLARLSHALQEAGSPTAVGEAFLDYTESFFSRGMLLRPEGELFRGWLARGMSGDRTLLRQVMTGPALTAEWRASIGDDDAATTEMTPSALASGVGAVLEREAGEAITLVPIRVQKRIVCLAVAVEHEELSRSDRELLSNATLRTGLALQSWILRHKSHPKEA